MSTDQTPALARAAEALAPSESRATKRTEYGEMSTPILLLSAKAAARAVVSAALHDPDDPDWLPDVIAAAIRDFHADPTIPHFARHVADAVRAAIIGPSS